MSVRINCYLYNTVTPAFKQTVRLLNAAQRKAVCYERRCVDFTICYQPQYFITVTTVNASGFDLSRNSNTPRSTYVRAFIIDDATRPSPVANTPFLFITPKLRKKSEPPQFLIQVAPSTHRKQVFREMRK